MSISAIRLSPATDSAAKAGLAQRRRWRVPSMVADASFPASMRSPAAMMSGNGENVPEPARRIPLRGLPPRPYSENP